MVTILVSNPLIQKVHRGFRKGQSSRVLPLKLALGFERNMAPGLRSLLAGRVAANFHRIQETENRYFRLAVIRPESSLIIPNDDTDSPTQQSRLSFTGRIPTE